MKTEELNRLLEKYYQGESTVEEERELRVFFNGKTIPEGYEAEKALFKYYLELTEVPEPSADFEAGILAGIDEFEKNRGTRKFISFILPALSTAAGILILAGSYFFFVHRAEPRDTFSDPELAYAETMKILTDVSSQMNRGTMALEPVARMNDVTSKSFEAINKPAKIVEKNLKNLDYLQKAIEITNVTLAKSTNKK